MEPSQPIKSLCISVGGERRAIMEEMFASEPFVGDFRVEFVDGVAVRDLKRRRGLEETVFPLLNGPCTFDGDALWAVVRKLDHEGRAVLACVIAHLRAWEGLGAHGAALVLEDNSRLTHDAAASIRATLGELEGEGGSQLTYFGFLGSNEMVTALHRDSLEPAARSGRLAAPLAFPVDTETGKPVDALWGSYCYYIHGGAARSILAELRSDLGSIMWLPRGWRAGKRAKVKPIDKILQRLAVRLGVPVHVATRPCAHRGLLRSKIHPRMDRRFAEATALQLALGHRSWSDVWLPKAEGDAAESFPLPAECEVELEGPPDGGAPRPSEL